jgi:hypothetical protein
MNIDGRDYTEVRGYEGTRVREYEGTRELAFGDSA